MYLEPSRHLIFLRSCCLHTCRAPTSGGQYHWVSMLAPRSSRKFLSFLTGWLTVTGWQASVASGGYLSGTLIQGMIVLNHPQYNPQRWQGTFLLWAVILVAVFINTVISSLLPMLEGLILIIHVLGFFAIMIPLVYTSSHGSASTVFTSFVNEGGWSSQGLSFWVGIIGNVFAFLGEPSILLVKRNKRRCLTLQQVPTELSTFVFPFDIEPQSIEVIDRCPKRFKTLRL